MIDVALIGGADVAAKLESIPPKLRSALEEGLGRLTLRLQSAVQAKLSGQVLHVRSGKLRSSIAEAIAGGPDSVSYILFSLVPYAAVHEFGFSGTQNVRESLRTVRQAFGRPISPVQAAVRAHSRKVSLPERSFLRSALAELEGSGLLAAEGEAAIARALA